MSFLESIHRLKRLVISALVADEALMGILVLKGGNALDLAYDITNRGSIDIDFSIEGDFTETEKSNLVSQFSHLLNKEFIKDGLLAFDLNLYERPQKISDAVKSFWGGYLIEFKVIQQNKFNEFKGDIESIRRNAIPLHTDNSTKFTIDISKYEYIAGKRPRDIEGAVVYVYSPEMLALEKLRALCQQIPNYKEVVLSMSPRSRARDFYDIHNLVETFKLDFTTGENTQLCGHIFEAKHVPLSYITMLPEHRDFHRQSWPSVVSTINQKEALKDFDFYFDYTINCCRHLAHSPLG